MSLIPQAFHLTFRNAWVSIGKLSYIICQNTYFFTFVKTNHYVRRPDKKVRQPRFSIQKDCIRQILFHGFYEYLHPFRDGNGRLGRMFTNFILLKKEQPILIIPREKREEYISALRFIRKERTDEYLIDFFFNTAIERMQSEIEEKNNMTNNFIHGINFIQNEKSTSQDNEIEA